MAITESAPYRLRLELLPVGQLLDVTFRNGLVKLGRLGIASRPLSEPGGPGEADARLVVRGRKGPRP
ncbi:hypothetical protein Cs7R123_74530 [Catellatospora sp. TT07R-123]|uniref:hypothetical protein n=1 Tax=Catellatospora sp. TT07R-123 TaxID=2733863 RepID=UPI001B024D9C|nr:hypothetical protein [Catellatospora sp. TT07R-123]GHJ50111.1 hypothetical protein Cs7R123_74530 [Catellatospora sp. TT07R-123]